MEEPGRLQSMGSLELDTTERLHFHFSLSCIGEGNGNPLQYPCLENLMDTGAWWTAVHGVAESGMTERLTLTYLKHTHCVPWPVVTRKTFFKDVMLDHCSTRKRDISY